MFIYKAHNRQPCARHKFIPIQPVTAEVCPILPVFTKVCPHHHPSPQRYVSSYLSPQRFVPITIRPHRGMSHPTCPHKGLSPSPSVPTEVCPISTSLERFLPIPTHPRRGLSHPHLSQQRFVPITIRPHRGLSHLHMSLQRSHQRCVPSPAVPTKVSSEVCPILPAPTKVCPHRTARPVTMTKTFINILVAKGLDSRTKL